MVAILVTVTLVNGQPRTTLRCKVTAGKASSGWSLAVPTPRSLCLSNVCGLGGRGGGHSRWSLPFHLNASYQMLCSRE